MARYRNENREQAGFTLIEVLITIALIGIVSAIGYPSVRDYVAKYNYRAAGREVLTTLMQARSNSIRDNANWLVSPDGADPTHKFNLVDPTGTNSRAHDLTSYGNGITLILTTATTCGGASGLTQAAAIGFSGRGFGTPVGAFYVASAGSNLCFEISASANGVARLRRFNGSVWQ